MKARPSQAGALARQMAAGNRAAARVRDIETDRQVAALLPATELGRAVQLANAIGAEIFLHGTCTDAALHRRGWHTDDLARLKPTAERIFDRQPVTFLPE